MKKRMKKITALMVTMCVVMGLLSGCTSAAEGKALYDAMMKSQSVKSQQIDMTYALRLDATGLSEQDQAAFTQMKTMLNGAKFLMNMKQKTNADNTAVQAQADVNMDMAGMSMDMGVWVDMDLNSSPAKLKEIVKLPPILTGMDPSMAGKEYMVMDFSELLNTAATADQAPSLNAANTVKLTKELQTKMTAFMGKYLLQYDPGFKFITDAGVRDVTTPQGTVKAHIYQIKLDDKGAKQLVRYTVNNLANNKDAMNFVVEYMKLIQTFAPSASGENSPAAEYEKFIADFEKEKPELLAKFNKSMDEIENIKLIGDKGILLEYAIDENGYIISQSGSMDFIIDAAKLGSLQGLEDSKPVSAGVYNVGFDFSMLMYNINKDFTIEMPAVTPTNSINYSDMLKSTIPTEN